MMIPREYIGTSQHNHGSIHINNITFQANPPLIMGPHYHSRVQEDQWPLASHDKEGIYKLKKLADCEDSTPQSCGIIGIRLFRVAAYCVSEP